MGSLTPVDIFVTPKAQGTSHRGIRKTVRTRDRKSAVRLSSRNDSDAAPILL